MRRSVALAFGLVVVLAAPVARPAPTFVGLGVLPGSTRSNATGVSADGSVVVGISSGRSVGTRAFRWAAAEGMTEVGLLPGDNQSKAYAVSADGTVIVGESSSSASLVSQAFRWTRDDGAVGLGFLPTDLGGFGLQSHASAASADGSVVAGLSASNSTAEAFRWTSAGGMVGLGVLPGDIDSYASGVSTDGSYVVGSSRFQDSGIFFEQPYRWTAETGMIGLGQLRDANWSYALGVSDDGSVIVGQSSSFDLDAPLSPVAWTEAFLWTEASGMRGLGFLPGDTASSASAVSADGSLVVGQSGSVAFIWDSVHGMRSLRDVLVNGSGLDLTGWTLSAASAISADGHSIVGWGIDPNGVQQAWLAVLPTPTQCSDGFDNDGDGLTDLADRDCGGDPSHPSELPACSDGIDDDGDGQIDFDGGASANHGVALGPPDPGCPVPYATAENPQCDDGIDNDGNGLVDLADPKCSLAWPYWEKTPTATCGLGVELSLVVPLLACLRGRRQRLRAAVCGVARS